MEQFRSARVVNGVKNPIGWTHDTRNPLVGCSDAIIVDPETGRESVSPTCPGCWAKGQVNRGMSPQHRGLTVLGDHGPDWTGEVRLVPHILDERIPRPRDGGVRRVFAPSLSDPFHETLMADRGRHKFVVAMLGWMLTQPWVDWQVLTKRAFMLESFMLRLSNSKFPLWERLARAMESLAASARLHSLAADLRERAPLSFDNILFGVTVENDLAARARLPHLVRARKSGLIDHSFVSYEPALGRIDFTPYIDGIDWLIIGGESGPKARPMHPAWVRAAISVAHAHGVPVFFKQWGEWSPDGNARKTRLAHDDLAGPQSMHRVGRKAAGKSLDGKTFFEWPCLRGEQRVAYTWTPPARYRRRLVTQPVTAPVWPTADAARAAAPKGAMVLELELPKPYKRAVYASAKADAPEQDRLRVEAKVGGQTIG